MGVSPPWCAFLSIFFSRIRKEYGRRRLNGAFPHQPSETKLRDVEDAVPYEGNTKEHGRRRQNNFTIS